jgi:hypothetical protein
VADFEEVEMAGDRAPVSTSAFWEALYASSQDGWELGEPAPSLVTQLDAGLPVAPGSRVAVPGAGPRPRRAPSRPPRL